MNYSRDAASDEAPEEIGLSVCGSKESIQAKAQASLTVKLNSARAQPTTPRQTNVVR